MEPSAEKLLAALDDAAAAAGAEIERTLHELTERTRALAETTAARDAKEAELERTTEEYRSLLMQSILKAADDRMADTIGFQLSSMRQFVRGLKRQAELSVMALSAQLDGALPRESPLEVLRAKETELTSLQRQLDCVATATLTGALFPFVPVDFAAQQGETRVLGYTSYNMLWSLFEGAVPKYIPGFVQLGTSGATAPRGSIQSGFIVSDAIGGARGLVCARTHASRRNDRSDISGGFAINYGALPFQYLSRVALSPTVLLPPYGVCFQSQDEGKLFGSGWVAMPLFDFDSAGVEKAPLTWTYFADAENFTGPVCCYPPQAFARRIHEWAEHRKAEDASFSPESTDVGESMAFGHDDGHGDLSLNTSADPLYMACAFATDYPDGDPDLLWSVPEIRVPPAGSAWLADAAFYTERNFERLTAGLAGSAGVEGPEGPAADDRAERVARVTLEPTPARIQEGEWSLEIGVKRVVVPRELEIDAALRIDAHVSAVGDAYIVGGADAGKTLGRFFEQTSEVKEAKDDDGTGKKVHFAVPSTRESIGPIAKYEYAPRPQKTFRNEELEAYVRERSLYGIRTAVLEDGTQVRYGMVKFIEQPALASLAADFPADFTPAKLAQAQARFERLAASSFAEQMRRTEHTKRAGALVRLDGATLIEPVAGYVPVAVGSTPATGEGATFTCSVTW